jgi:hypothetical protein
MLVPVNPDLEDVLGIQIDPAKGRLGFIVVGGGAGEALGPIPGSSATLTPEAGDGPFYYDADGQMDLTATSALHWGGTFFNVPEGDYKVTFAAPIDSCAPISFPFASWGWPIAGETAVRAPVRAGFQTWGLAVYCPPE